MIQPIYRANIHFNVLVKGEVEFSLIADDVYVKRHEDPNKDDLLIGRCKYSYKHSAKEVIEITEIELVKFLGYEAGLPTEDEIISINLDNNKDYEKFDRRKEHGGK